MDIANSRVPETVPSAFEAPAPTALPLHAPEASELHREINARRAQLEDPELLRQVRAL